MSDFVKNIFSFLPCRDKMKEKRVFAYEEKSVRNYRSTGAEISGSTLCAALFKRL
jgi:hypothetical protein